MLSLKEKFKIGCACLVVLFVTLWILGPKFSKSPADHPAEVDTSQAYTFEQQQDALKSWMKEFELKTNAVNEQWKTLNEILTDTDQEGIYGKLDAVQENLENLEGAYSSLQLPKELTIEQQKILKQVSHDMDESISCRVKFIKLTEGYLLHQKSTLYRQSQQQKELIDLYQSNSSLEIKKLAETFKIQ
ncbi:MAG: hypothetical protein H6Q68_2861 [Firmicutes bacterium]|nr:hypothetical protein [Bacillota bacterium]